MLHIMHGIDDAQSPRQSSLHYTLLAFHLAFMPRPLRKKAKEAFCNQLGKEIKPV